MTTLSNSTDMFTPLMVTGYESERPARTIVHAILNSNAPAITLRDAGLRTGTLIAMFATAAEAAELETALSTAEVWELADASRPQADMSFVVTGSVSVEFPENLGRYLVVFGYQEVTP